MSELLVVDVKPRPMKYKALQVNKKNAGQIAAYLREFYKGLEIGNRPIKIRSGGGWVKIKFLEEKTDQYIEVTATKGEVLIIDPIMGIRILTTDEYLELFSLWSGK